MHQDAHIAWLYALCQDLVGLSSEVWTVSRVGFELLVRLSCVDAVRTRLMMRARVHDGLPACQTV